MSENEDLVKSYEKLNNLQSETVNLLCEFKSLKEEKLKEIIQQKEKELRNFKKKLVENK